jgi:hypothetical protein
MPESKARKRSTSSTKATTTRPTGGQLTRKRPPSPPWVGISILVLFGIGIVYLVLYYITGGGVLGQQSLGGWNILVGFAFIVAGFGMLTQWS